MHLPSYFLETAALVFALTGACFAWLTRWHVLLAAVAGSGLLFLAQCVLHMLNDDTVSLLVVDGPVVFYGLVSISGIIPAVIGAGLVRLVKRWRRT